MRQVMPHRNNIGAERGACKTFLAPARRSRPEPLRGRGWLDRSLSFG